MESLSRPMLPRSDLEEEALAQQQQENMAQAVIDQLGALLDGADGALTHLEDEGMLGSAIVRGCRDMADMIGGLADQIDQQSDEDRRALAQAVIEDAQSSFLLQQEEFVVRSGSTLEDGSENLVASEELTELSNISEEEMMTAIHAAGSLLRDVASTLRAIDNDEAEEIADVALTAAHLFVASLQSVHASLTPHDFTNNSRSLDNSSTRIELLEEEEEDEDDDKVTSRSVEYQTNTTAPKSTPPKSKTASKKRLDRIRVLWPPLGPAVAKTCDWGKQNATQRPLLTAALGLTLWPAAVMTTLIGAPIVLADGFVQDIYNNFQDAPIIQGLERSAAQVYHTGRLSLLCGKLAGRQTLRVVQKQVKRHGGAEKIAHDVMGMAVDRVTHPVETVTMAWNGLAWGIGVARDVVEQMTEQDERGDTVQDLQQ